MNNLTPKLLSLSAAVKTSCRLLTEPSGTTRTKAFGEDCRTPPNIVKVLWAASFKAEATFTCVPCWESWLVNSLRTSSESNWLIVRAVDAVPLYVTKPTCTFMGSISNESMISPKNFLILWKWSNEMVWDVGIPNTTSTLSEQAERKLYYHSMYFFLHFHRPRAHHVTCK